MVDLLKQISVAGGTGMLAFDASREERATLADALIELRKAGHAVSADEVSSAGDRYGDIRIIHYRTCVLCKKGAI